MNVEWIQELPEQHVFHKVYIFKLPCSCVPRSSHSETKEFSPSSMSDVLSRVIEHFVYQSREERRCPICTLKWEESVLSFGYRALREGSEGHSRALRASSKVENMIPNPIVTFLKSPRWDVVLANIGKYVTL